MSIIPNLPDGELLTVNKPAQYLGGEAGCVIKDPSAVRTTICLAFPDLYEIGMSHLGLQILYGMLNSSPGIQAERVYVPEPDMEALIRSRGIPLWSLETKRALHEFDILGFSLQYELCATGLLQILDLGRIPLLARDRGEHHPLVIGGGPMALQPEPLADFFDALLPGDAEELLPEFIKTYEEGRSEGLGKKALLERLSLLPGVYVPSLSPAAGRQVTKRILPSLDQSQFPLSPVIPSVKAVHDRLGIEIMRGCLRGCRFCQAGFIYRPQRERSPEEILKIAEKAVKNTGYDEISLLSLSSADYGCILALLGKLKKSFAGDDGISISFPSTRVDALTRELLAESLAAGRGNFTIAPEGGSQRIRDVINKGLSDQQILDTCQNVFRSGCRGIKLYFMIGLPTETDEDILGIVNLAHSIKKMGGHGKRITVSVSTFVPKAHTPFQWAGQISEEETLRKQQFLKDNLRRAGIELRWHDAFSSTLEGIFARGGRELSGLILKAYKLGCRLDAWDEHLKKDLWRQAITESGLSVEKALSGKEPEAALPWDHISSGVSKSFLEAEWQKARWLETTPDCASGSCTACGVCNFDDVKNIFSSPVLPESGELPTPLAEKQHSHEDRQVPPRFGGAVQRLRLRYSKKGTAKFIAHLDTMHLFLRAFRRLGTPIAFTLGCNPRPKVGFGPPLQLGIESECEFFDIYLLQNYPPGKLAEELNACLPAGLVVTGAADIPLEARAIQDATEAQTYLVEPENEKPLEITPALLSSWKEIMLERVRKNSTASVPLGQFVTELKNENGALEFTLRSYTSTASIKPQEVVKALLGKEISGLSVRKLKVTLAA